MSAYTNIEWTDRTWNVSTGCTKVSPGCKNCYAEGVAERFWAKQYPPIPLEPVGDWRDGEPASRDRKFTDVQTHADRLEQPLHWKKPARIFVNSMSDLFHEDVPDAFIDQVFAVMALAPRHTFQVLTKRAERMRVYFADKGDYVEQWYRRVFAIHRRMRDDGRFEMPTESDEQFLIGRSVGALTCGDHASRSLPNVWLGVSVENQEYADERIPLLLQTPAAVRFISAEPLLGPVDLGRWLATAHVTCKKCTLSFWLHDAEPCEHRLSGAWTLACPHCGDCRCSPGWSEMDARAVNMEPPADWIARNVGRFDRVHPTIPLKSGLDWVIVGGESGPKARPFNVSWARSIVKQCKAANLAVFVKQLGRDVRDRNDAGFMGEWPEAWPDHIDIEDRVEHDLDGTRDGYQGAPVRVHLRNKKGGDPSEWPEDLRVREFPQ